MSKEYAKSRNKIAYKSFSIPAFFIYLLSKIQSYAPFSPKVCSFIIPQYLHISFKRKTKGEFIMINDFGEKIGGARKDLWKERGLMVEDLNGMTQGEKEKYVKKDCVWPKEDMKALVADGMPRFVVYFRNEVRKWVHPQPKARISAEAYIEGVRKIKELTGSIKEESDIPVFVEKLTSMILFKSGC